MNRLERFVYDRLKRNPRIKLLVRDIYQTLFDVLPATPCRSAYPIDTREGYFFGFHDHIPFSADNQLLAANHHTIGRRMPIADDELEVGFFHGENYQDWVPVGSTRAWNWHQGCKLQWRGARRELIYNDYVGGKFIARIHNVDSGEECEVPYAVSSVSPDGRWAVGYSFERVQRYMPGYGYIQTADEPQLDTPQPEQSGLYVVDLDTGDRRDLVDIARLAAYQPEPNSQTMWHYVSHAIFSPSSDRVVFLHRWVPEDTRNRRTRMFTCGLGGEDLYLFPTREMVSHIGWRNEQEIIAYCRLIDGRDCYVLFRDQAPDGYQILGEHLFSSDGHPSFSPDGRWMLTDTYPDRRRQAKLILFDAETSTRYDIAQLHSPRRFATTHPQRHWACDLHPRFDRTGRYLCFDAVYTGTRALSTIDLGETALAHPPKALNRCV